MQTHTNIKIYYENGYTPSNLFKYRIVQSSNNYFYFDIYFSNNHYLSAAGNDDYFFRIENKLIIRDVGTTTGFVFFNDSAPTYYSNTDDLVEGETLKVSLDPLRNYDLFDTVEYSSFINKPNGDYNSLPSRKFSWQFVGCAGISMKFNSYAGDISAILLGRTAIYSINTSIGTNGLIQNFKSTKIGGFDDSTITVSISETYNNILNFVFDRGSTHGYGVIFGYTVAADFIFYSTTY